MRVPLRLLGPDAETDKLACAVGDSESCETVDMFDRVAPVLSVRVMRTDRVDVAVDVSTSENVFVPVLRVNVSENERSSVFVCVPVDVAEKLTMTVCETM